MPRHPDLGTILARLAGDTKHQVRGLGQALLKDALLRTVQAADIAGIRAFLVHARNERGGDGKHPGTLPPVPRILIMCSYCSKDLKVIVAK